MSQGSPYGSQPNPYGNQNPYVSPQGGWGQPDQWSQPGGHAPGVPGFCTTMFVVSLCFCVIRGVLVAVGFLGLAILPAGSPAVVVVYFELATGIGMVLCGLPANSLLLAKNQIGIFLGWGLVFFTIAS